MAKLGIDFHKVNQSTWQLKSNAPLANSTDVPLLNVYADHRLAMAFAPLALKLGSLQIDDPHCVEKSYPGYWNQLERTGAFAFE
jgi:3-phosphoshikimate 1-carboxyvinyltransferase